MLETYVRPIYQNYFADPIAKKISLLPQKITYLACLTGILVMPALFFDFTKLALILMILSGFLDTLDGTVARITDKTSSLGSILDIISDRIVEFSIMMGLFLVDPTHRAIAILMMLGSCYLCVTIFLVIGIFTPNQSVKGFHYSPGFIERAEAFIFFGAMIIAPHYFYLLAYLFVSLVLLTCYLHIKQFISHTKQLPK
ncbi:MAG: phosphatidoglycerophosphate synthase [uncultured bacterium]|nr:MAG: phosphatidoglycerophosphate synthase [uncultured bacterium]